MPKGRVMEMGLSKWGEWAQKDKGHQLQLHSHLSTIFNSAPPLQLTGSQIAGPTSVL